MKEQKNLRSRNCTHAHPHIMNIPTRGLHEGPYSKARTKAAKYGLRRHPALLLVLLKRVPIRIDRAARRAMTQGTELCFNFSGIRETSISWGPRLGPPAFVFTAICKAPFLHAGSPSSCCGPVSCCCDCSFRVLLVTHPCLCLLCPQPFGAVLLTKRYGASRFFCAYSSDHS